jgi:hypothetical protein
VRDDTIALAPQKFSEVEAAFAHGLRVGQFGSMGSLGPTR